MRDVDAHEKSEEEWTGNSKSFVLLRRDLVWPRRPDSPFEPEARNGAGYQENCRRQFLPLSGCFAWDVALYRRGWKCRQNFGSLGCVWCNVDSLRR